MVLKPKTLSLMQWSSAISGEPAIEDAIEAVTAEIGQEIQGEAADLAVAFVSPQFSARYRDIPELLARALPHRMLLGCSAGGVIGGGREIEQRPGFALTVARLPEVTVTPLSLPGAVLPDLDSSPSAWHQVIGIPPDPLPHFILLADPFTFPAEDFLAGLDFAYPRSVKIGGLASAARARGENALYVAGAMQRAGAVGVALAGDIAVDSVVAQGCRPIGRPMRITGCQGHLVLELDGRTPLAALHEVFVELSERDRQLASHSLFFGIVMDELAAEHRAGDFLIRNIIGVDPQRGTIAIGEHLREGQTVQFHLRDARTAAEDLHLVLERYASQGTAAAARGALLFSCLGRGVFLYGRPDHDTGIFKEQVGDVPLGGFFCNGEIGPVGGATRLHGYTSSFGIFRPARKG